MKNLSLLFLILCTLSCAEKAEQYVPKQYSIDQFYQNSRIGGGAFSEDETKLLVSSDESGIFNVYEITIEDGSKKQITNSSEESFFAVDYVPGTGQVLYSADKGGNEINHIYLFKEDGSSQDLTPGEKEKASFAGWSEDKQFMYYVSNKRDERFFDLYKMSVDDWEAELIYQNDDGLDISDMSNDENLYT